MLCIFGPFYMLGSNAIDVSPHIVQGQTISWCNCYPVANLAGFPPVFHYTHQHLLSLGENDQPHQTYHIIWNSQQLFS